MKQKVRNCSVCEKERKYPPELLIPSKLPDYSGKKVGMDLFELKGHTYLIIIDYYSRWIEVSLLQKTTSGSIVNNCKSVFSWNGIPELVISDNGPQFTSKEFLDFSNRFGFVHLTSSPHHTQGNGKAERAVQTIKNLLKKASDSYIALLNYRSTPLQYGKSPAELFMKRKLRTQIPTISAKYRFCLYNAEKYKSIDAKIKERQKKKRISTSVIELEEQPVWVNILKTTQAKVEKSLSPMSVPVKTDSGLLR